MKEYRIKIRKFLFQHVLVLSLTVILVSLYFLSAADSGYIGIDLLLTNIKGRLPISITLIAFMVFMGLSKDCFRKKGFIKGIISGLPFMIIGILYFIVLLIGMDWQTYFSGINALAMIAVFFDMFCTGLFEEVLMRGVVFQSLTEKWGRNKSGTMKSLLISSFLFGIIHILNYSPGLFVATVSQIIFTTFIGMFLCSIFICTGRNIWTVIALHTIFDLITLILQQEFVYSSPGQVSDLPILMGVITVAATLPLGLLSIRNLNKHFDSGSF